MYVKGTVFMFAFAISFITKGYYFVSSSSKKIDSNTIRDFQAYGAAFCEQGS
jgi:hypothetical protein